MKNHNNKKGFTIIEVVVVITIIGILAGIALPSVTGILGNANNSVDNARAGLYESALKIYVSRNAQVQEYVYISKSPGDEQLVANTIAHVLDEKTSFEAKTKNWVFYYNPTTLQVVAAEKADEDNGQPLELTNFLPLIDGDKKALTGEPNEALLVSK